jgi:hypothetical protein
MWLAKNEIETFLKYSTDVLQKCKTSFCYYKNRNFKCDECILFILIFLLLTIDLLMVCL